jgi:hypothetical protein
MSFQDLLDEAAALVNDANDGVTLEELCRQLEETA